MDFAEPPLCFVLDPRSLSFDRLDTRTMAEAILTSRHALDSSATMRVGGIQSTNSARTKMRLSSRGWLAMHLATLVIAFGILFALNVHAWFIGDEWDMIVRVTQPLTVHALFVPHNEHWSTVPILIYRVLVDLFGLRTYVPYLFVLFAAHLCLAHLLWRLMRQVGASDACATALAAIFAVLGAGAQNLTNAF